MESYAPLLTGLVALLVGIAAGKAWERYKLQEGRWIDRRRARESPHFILGLNSLVSHQIDKAIEELTQASRFQPEALEIEMILGNLYREKGQVGRAITIHQGLLQRPKLTRLEHAYVLLCLGLDYKRGGFVDRALEAFNEVLGLDTDNPYALVNLQKLYEEQHQWQEAHDVRQRLVAQSGAADEPRNRQILAFIETEMGRERIKQLDYAGAAARFESALALDGRTVPAYLTLGDVRLHEGNLAAAAEAWEQVAQVAPERAYLAFDRLESLYARQHQSPRFEALCRRLIAANPKDWRAHLALARHLLARQATGEALELLLEAISHSPHALTIHQAIWHALLATGLDAALVNRYTEMT
ncbi:MAG: tetratricopeptide repeat protein, partial [Acidobacteria bacterium]|nr:tetratricopeptide repeat protein [Acidobacteriota bacterium]